MNSNLPTTPDGLSAVSMTASAEERVAKGLALALGEAQARVIVARALRESDLSEHKIDFNSWIVSRDGSAVLARMASRLELGESELRSIIDELPPLDLYMVAREHRRTWRPSDAVAVAVQLRNGPPTFAISSEGSPLGLAIHERVLPSTALLLLQAAEPKENFTVTRFGPSDVIEGSGERRVRGWVLPAAQCNPDTDPNGCESGGGGGSGGGWQCTGYDLKQIATSNLVDNGNPFEGNEIEVHGSDGTASGYVRVTEVGSTDVVNLNERIFCGHGAVSFMTKETDGGFNPDDDFTKPLPNTSKSFSLLNGVAAQLYGWPSQLDPLYYDWQVAVKVEW